jgi:hypothetical protein
VSLSLSVKKRPELEKCTLTPTLTLAFVQEIGLLAVLRRSAIGGGLTKTHSHSCVVWGRFGMIIRSGYLQCSEASREGLTQRPHGFAVTGFFLAARASKLAPRQTKKPSTLRVGAFVPEIGVEPIHPCGRQILSLLRLPIPPPGLGEDKNKESRGYVQTTQL